MRAIHPLKGLYPAEARYRELSSPWELYHQASKLFVDDLSRSSLSAPTEIRADRIGFSRLRLRERIADEVSAAAPTRSSCFPTRPKVLLPLAPQPIAVGLSATVETRRSALAFAGEAISREALAQLLTLCAGVTHTHPRGYPLRAAPASGALYEIEIYAAVRRVDGLDAGLYHYHAGSHSLAMLRGPEANATFAAATVIRKLVESSAVQFFLTSVIGRLEWKYAQRSYRYTLLNAGHLAEHVCLGAAALGLASAPYGGFIDDPTAKALGVDGVTEIPLHSVVVGQPVAAPLPPPSRPGERGFAAPRLRRFDRVAPALGDGWQSLDRAAARGLYDLVGARSLRGRETLLRLRALLPGDRTLADYCAVADEGALALEVSEEAVFAFPSAWDTARREVWRTVVARAAVAVRGWLGIGALPRAFFELRTATRQPETLNRDRWLHRKIRFPEGLLAAPPLELVVHELMHASYLPDNRFLAEGVAAVAGLAPAALRELGRTLREEGPPPLGVWLFGTRGPLPRAAQAAAASFVGYLVDAFGRDAFFAFANPLVYPALPSERRSAPRHFSRVFGADAELVARRWWGSLG